LRLTRHRAGLPLVSAQDRLPTEQTQRLIHRCQAQTTHVHAALIEGAVSGRAPIPQQGNQEMQRQRLGRSHALGHAARAFDRRPNRFLLVVRCRPRGAQQILCAQPAIAQQTRAHAAQPRDRGQQVGAGYALFASASELRRLPFDGRQL
jgi:hypothetical protein